MKKITLITFLFSTILNAQITDVITNGLNNVQDLYFVGNELYIVDFGNNKILIADISNTNPTPTEVITYTNPRAITVLANELYVCGSSPSSVKKYDLNDTSTSSTVVFSISNGSKLIIDNNIIYASQQASGLVSKMDLSTAPNTSTILFDLDKANDLFLDGNIMYIAEGDTETVSSFNINDINPSLNSVVTNIGSAPQALAILNNYLYIAVNNPNKIYRIDLSNSNATLEEIATLDNDIAALSFRGNDLYIGHLNKISKLDLNTLTTNSIDIKEKEIEVFPNPTTDIVEINGIENIEKIEIFDLTGKLITTKNTKEIDVSNLENGIYFVKINELITKKLIKK